MSQDVLEKVFSKEKEAESELQLLQESLSAKLAQTKKDLEDELTKELEKTKKAYEDKLDKELAKLSEQLAMQEKEFQKQVKKYNISDKNLPKVTKQCFLSIKDGN